MKIQPKENYELIGTGIRLDKTKIYNAVHATNQPDFEELGLVFCEEILLNKNEYDIIHTLTWTNRHLFKGKILESYIPNIIDNNWDKVELILKGANNG